jgi:hypothetical protein
LNKTKGCLIANFATVPVAELHREAQPIGRAAPLPDDGAFAERVVTDQLILGVRQRQQAFALGGGRIERRGMRFPSS